MLQSGSMPKIPNDDDQQVQSGNLPSQSLAWSVLSNLTSKSHSSNTIGNAELKLYLESVIKKLNDTCGNLEVSTQQTNVVVNPGQIRHVYFQSDNLVVRLMGRNPQALLISSHFDSAIHSRGGTDAGMGIASMMASLDALSKLNCKNMLLFSVIFNFSNSEEDYLLGSSAFTKHPWFKDIKSFINLEVYLLIGNRHRPTSKKRII